MSRLSSRIAGCIDFLAIGFMLVCGIMVSYTTLHHRGSEKLTPPSEPEQGLALPKRNKSTRKMRKIMYDRFTSYDQVLGGPHNRTNYSTSDDFYFSEVIPKHIREEATDGKECRSYYVHYNYGDGFGHQLNDMAASMVYHLLNQEQDCFLGIVYYDGDHNQFDHGCKSCIEVYNALSRQWPGISSRKPNRTIHKFDSTTIWNHVLKAGGETKWDIIPCPHCDKARMTVARLWVDVVKQMAAKRSTPTVDIAIHIRKGDFPRYISDSYADVIDRMFPHVPVDIFTENQGEAHELLIQLNRTHEVRVHEGGDAVDDWLIMAQAKVLFLHESSYSISASIASEGIVFSQTQKPYQGRYDNHYFPCKIHGGWWVSTGHGNTTCDLEKLYAVSSDLIEKYYPHQSTHTA